jgi:cobalt-zinc-cadmium efflux system membrane fusion protein
MGKRKKIAIAVALAVGLGASALVMYEGEKEASTEEHGHEEPDAHREREHHDGEQEKTHSDADDHADSEHHAESEAKGPNGGILFSHDDIGLELVAPEDAEGQTPMSVFLFKDNNPVKADRATTVEMTIRRPTGETSTVVFEPKANGYFSQAGIAEPHVFDAEILLVLNGKTFTFGYSKEEGKLELSPEQIKAARIGVATAQPRAMSTSLSLPGEIRFDEDRTAHVVPRVAGVVESVAVNLGQAVKKGDLLAVIASQQISDQRSELAASQRRVELARTTFERERQLWKDKISAEQDYLQARQGLQEAEIALNNARQKMSALSGGITLAGGNRYELRAPFDGVVVEKHLVSGEVVNESSNAFTLSDLSRVWATFNVSPKDLSRVQVGRPVKISAPELNAEVTGSVSYVGNLLGEQTRTATARATLENPQGSWRPGLFVSVLLATESHAAPVTVPEEAIQTIEDKPAVFIRVDGGFVAQPVVLGTRDSGHVEIKQGLKSGIEIASTGSFILKSELGKGSAEHSH